MSASALTPEQLDQLARAVPDLAPQLTELKTELLKPGLVTRSKHGLRRAGAAVVSAFTSPDVVKAEKSLAVLVITRLLITVGASAGTVDLAKILLKALGV